METITVEEWRFAPGHFGTYEVSNFGRIRRSTPGRGACMGRVLNPYFDKKGYCRVSINRKKIKKTTSVHRLVLETFLGNDPKKQTNHKNGIKTDNRLENLEWVTGEQNLAHALKNGLCHSKLKKYQVVEIKKRIQAKEPQQQIAKRFNVHRTAISAIAIGRNWKHL